MGIKRDERFWKGICKSRNTSSQGTLTLKALTSPFWGFVLPPSIKEGLEGLKGKIPGLVDIKVNTNGFWRKKQIRHDNQGLYSKTEFQNRRNWKCFVWSNRKIPRTKRRLRKITEKKRIIQGKCIINNLSKVCAKERFLGQKHSDCCGRVSG